jgi:putative Mg2+ transporter-C (MgtC) family protein
VNVTPLEILIRLSAAVVLGALIGLERQWHHKHAGVKTHTLVSLGATAFSLVSVVGLGPNSAPTQLAVGVVTGIGFIGGGVIMRRGGSIQGITTAATLWATASLGLALGGGLYFLAVVVAACILVVELMLRFVDAWIDYRAPVQSDAPSHRLLVAFRPPAEKAVRGAVDAFTARAGVAVYASAETRSAAELRWELRLCVNPARGGDLSALIRDLRGAEDVFQVEWSRTPPDPSD